MAYVGEKLSKRAEIWDLIDSFVLLEGEQPLLTLCEMVETGDLKYNAVLEEGDIIWMPTNPFAWFGRIVQNILAPVQPAIQAYSTPYRIADVPDQYDNNNRN